MNKHHIFRALIFPPYFLGIPEKLSNIIIGLTLIFFVGLGVWWIIFFTIGAYISLRFVCKDDPFLIEAYFKSMNIPDELG